LKPISELPSKAYHLADFNAYERICGRRWAMYISSLACPYDCGYCTNKGVYGRKWNALDPEQVADIRRGGYVLAESPGGAPAVVLIATGSEVALAMDARKALAEAGIAARVVSMPATSVFDRQDETYRASVLPRGVKRVSIEAGVTDGWRKYVGLDGAAVGIDSFGESAPAGDLFKHFGFTVANVVKTVRSVL
jgi:transketolase